MAHVNPLPAIQNILVALQHDLAASTPFQPTTLANYLTAQGYLTTAPKPPLQLTGVAAQDKNDTVHTILVHLAKVYAGYDFQNTTNTRPAADRYQMLIYFFNKLAQSLNGTDQVKMAALLALTLATKYPPAYDCVFADPLNYRGDVDGSGRRLPDIFDMLVYGTGDKMVWNDQLPWLSPPWIINFCKKVYDNPDVKDLIERALLSGNFPTLHTRPLVDGRRLLFPSIDIALISYPRGSVSGFAGNRRVHIAIDELVQKTLQYFSQKRTSEDLTLWVKLQLAATTIHEISHVILRANYNDDVNISSPMLAPVPGPPGTRESGFLSEILFCQERFNAPAGRICLWDFFICDDNGPYRNKSHPEHAAFNRWLTGTVADLDSQSHLFRTYSAAGIVNYPNDYFYDPARSLHSFAI